jgi:hypothetical protein
VSANRCISAISCVAGCTAACMPTGNTVPGAPGTASPGVAAACSLPAPCNVLTTADGSSECVMVRTLCCAACSANFTLLVHSTTVAFSEVK